MRLAMPGPAAHKSSPTREQPLLPPYAGPPPGHARCGFITFQERLRQTSARPKDNDPRGEDADTVVLAIPSEDAMKTIRAAAHSIRPGLDDAAFTVCLSGIALAFAALAGSA